MKQDYPTAAGIYKLTSISGKVYIGKAVNIKNRINSHKNCHKRPNGRYHLQNAIIRHGWDTFKVEILETIENFDRLKDNVSLLDLEAFYIKLYGSTNREKGYNICKYSCDRTGVPMSEESKEKLRIANLGKKHSEETKLKMSLSSLGKPKSKETKLKMSQGKADNPMSEESKEKLRQFNLGKTLTIEHREKLRLAKLGKKLSPETKEKMRIAQLGKIKSEETKNKIRQTTLRNKNGK